VYLKLTLDTVRYVKLRGLRECHIGGDFLLAYKLGDSVKHDLMVFVRAGKHIDEFEKPPI